MPSDLQPYARVEQAFGNPNAVEARQNARIELLLECYNAYSGFGYGPADARVDQAVLNPVLAGQGGSLAAQALLQPTPGLDFDGIILGEKHSEPQAKHFLITHMAALAAAGVNTIYVEHFQRYQQVFINDFLASPAGSAVPNELDTFLRTTEDRYHLPVNSNLRGLLGAAKAAVVRVQAFDDNTLSRQAGGAAAMQVRDMVVNRLGENEIRDDAAARGAGKYIILAGRKHNNSHPGLTNGIPGFSQILRIPAVTVDPTSGNLLLDPDVAARRVP